MMPSLMIDHLSINLRSGTDNLVSEISFAIKEGESLILLGQSGSGKTMTCSAVLNLLDPKKFKVSGSVFFGETDLLNSSEKQRRGIYGNQIVYALRLRGIGTLAHPSEMLEYRMVPLLTELVQVGNELSASAMTRGLDAPNKRTNVCRSGFHAQDIIAFVFCAVVIMLFIISKVLGL